MSKNNKGSLKFQVLKRIDSLKKFGEGKDPYKEMEREISEKNGTRWNPAKVPGVHSTTTCDSYKKATLNFVDWTKVHHPEIKNLDYLQEHKEVVGEWLTQRIEEGKSNFTIRKEACAVAKVLGCSSNDFGIQMPSKKDDVITRSRGEKEHDKHFSEEKNKDMVDFCRAVGPRRRELEALSPKDIYKRDDNVYVHIRNGKGGKHYEQKVIDEYKDKVWDLKSQREAEGRQKMFDHVHNKADIHGYRGDHARLLYNEVVEKLEKGTFVEDRRSYDKTTDRFVEDPQRYSQEKVSSFGSKSDNYRTRDGSHRSFSRVALNYVGSRMGHGDDRCGDVVKHYM